VELENEQAVRAVAPNFGRLRDLEAGVIVTSRSDDPAFDFVSRFFGPAFGIDEDPVTGSAHCHSGPYWQNRLGKSELLAHQVSRREGVVRVRVSGDRTLLGGQAVTVFRGELAVPVPAAP
jgi:predicted PhzF superfamily epimerase YddE/YHI9